MEDRTPLADIANPDARLDELEYRLTHGDRSQAVEAALRSLSDAYPPIRHRATTALAARVDETLANLFGALVVGDEEATGRALADLEFDEIPQLAPNSAIRQAACRILAHTKGEATRHILEQATSDHDDDVRYQALVALHQLEPGDDELEPVVAPRLQDADPEIATVAAQITAERGWTDYTEALEAIWERTDGPARLQFALSIAELVGDHGAEIDEATLDRLVDEVIDALDEEETTAAAARALVHLGADRAIEPLHGVLDGWFVHPILRVEAASALIELDDRRGYEYLEKALDHRRDDVRGYALRTIGRLGLERHFDELVETAKVGGYHADTAVIALAEWGSDEALEALERLEQAAPNEDVRRLAGRVLLQLRELGEFDPELFEFM